MDNLKHYTIIGIRILAVVVAVSIGLKVLIYSTELWRKIFVIIGVPLFLYAITTVRRRKCTK